MQVSSAGLASLIQKAPLPPADSGLLLGAHISKSLKEKIWSNAYIDMSLLFIESPSSVIAKAHRSSGSEVALVVEGDKMFLWPNASPTGRQSKLDTWDKWVSAFSHIYCHLYCSVSFARNRIVEVCGDYLHGGCAIPGNRFALIRWAVPDAARNLPQPVPSTPGWL